LLARARDRDTDANGSLDERLYAMHDANFNVTGLVNTSGTVVERYACDPFGVPTYFDASYGTRGSSSYGWDYLHQGLRWDGDIGKYYNRRREYDPGQGRFTSNDPLLFGANDVVFYRYEKNGPLSTLDPSGLDEIGRYRPPSAAKMCWRRGGLYGVIAGELIIVGDLLNELRKAAEELRKAEEAGRALDLAREAAEAARKANGPNKPPPLPPIPPHEGDCTPAEHAALQAAVNLTCKVKRRCNAIQSPAELQANLAKNLACAAARDAINKKCYKGGDAIHRNAANDARRAATRCLELID